MIVGISELESETILLYPNPMTDRAYLEFEGTSNKTIRLIDSNGREIRVWESVNSDRIEIKREELASGTYFVSVNDGENVQTLSLVVR